MHEVNILKKSDSDTPVSSTLTLPGLGGVKVTRRHINPYITAGKRKKIRIWGMKNALPNPHNPTYTQRFHCIYVKHFHDAYGVN